MGDMTDPAMPMPPGGIEIVFSFDTTGSMGSYIGKVRTQVSDIITRLLGDVPFLRIGVFAHGDYCDSHTYVTKHVDFTRDAEALCKFVREVGGTGGGDWEECYELVLQEVRTKLSWQPGTQRALVMIGDAIPHDVNYYRNRKKGKGKALKEIIDWKEETRRLRDEAGVHVYAVQCGQNNRADFFYEHLANETGGKRLMLDNFEGIVELIMAICYRETGPDVFTAYEREIRDRDGAAIRKDLDAMFTDLRDPVAGSSATGPSRPTLSTADSTSTKRGTKRKLPAAFDDEAVDDEDEDDEEEDSGSEFEPSKRKVVKAKRRKTDTASKVAGAKKGAKKTAKVKVPLVKVSSKGASSLEDFIEGYEQVPRRREAKASARYAFTDLNWSRWRLAMAKESAVDGARGRWRPRTSGHMGMRNVSLFEEGRDEPAIYEVAVQLNRSAIKHVVLLRSSGGFDSKCWDTYLLRDLKVRRKIDNIISLGHKLYVRRALLTLPHVTVIEGKKVKVEDVDELRRLMCTVYDYPWIERRLEGDLRGSRMVKRSGVVISGNSSSFKSS